MYDITSFSEQVFPSLVDTITFQSRTNNLKPILIHLDNLHPHDAEISQDYLDGIKVERFAHQSYRPDLAPSDFLLFA
jgi:hypothetical protein